jgi:hypothetical protein
VVGDGTTGRCSEVSGETCAGSGERRRSQSLHSTEAMKVAAGAGSKTVPREGRQEGWVREFHREAERKPSAGSARKGYTRRKDPRPGLAVGASFGVE